MKIYDFFDTLKNEEARGYELNSEQKQAVTHTDGPLWMIAGPGSGKSEVLVTRALKLMCVDGVNPRSIILTTFTRKAAQNLEDRLVSYLSVLQKEDTSLQTVDLADMRIGTIHSLCDDILHDYRYPYYQNVRLLDDVEQNLFAYRHATIANLADLAFWKKFEYAVPMWRASGGYPPNKWQRVKAGLTLFNHLVEDVVDLNKMKNQGGHWETLVEHYEQYTHVLKDEYRCDFAHLQKIFLQFITSPAGERFLDGDNQERQPLIYILVDEYQDTNPIQERIYLTLASRAPHNLTVVGDDDQALYRFRGGTVASMVNFDKACQHVFQTQPTQLQLDKNYRSHPKIVEFFNDYITSFPEMLTSGVRAPNKVPIQAKSKISGDYQAVAWICTNKAGDLAESLAYLVKNHLLADGIVDDPSQCVLLMRSTKDTPRNAGPYIKAFADAGIPIYNPRSKSFMDSEEVQCLLATLIHIIDLQDIWQMMNLRDLPETVAIWVETLKDLKSNTTIDTTELETYIKGCNNELPKLCKKNKTGFLNVNLHEIIFRIISREPFASWRKNDPVKNLRLSKVTRLFEGYHSLNLDTLRANEAGTDIDPNFLYRFYNMFVGYLIQAGIDDDEDEEVIVPKGYLPIMTIHQAKGLEFPFVFVSQVGNKGQISSSQILEHELAPFRQTLYARTPQPKDKLVIEDDIRLLYVAYSRPEYALVIVATRNQIKNNVAVPGRDSTQFQYKAQILK